MRKFNKVISILVFFMLSTFFVSCSQGLDKKALAKSEKNVTSSVVGKDKSNSDSGADTQNNTKDNPTIDGKLTVNYINVGQGDSELIQVDNKFNILIDAGNNDNKTLDYLKSLGIKKLDYVIATHPHADHIGNMDSVIKSFEIGTFYAPKIIANTKTYENMVKALKAKNLKMTVPKVGDQLTIGAATLTFLAPNSDNYEDMNNYSIVCKLKYGNERFLFMGDAETLSEGEILNKQLDIKADVLKLGHHGSNSSSSENLLNIVNPQYGIISCGTHNDYAHPHKTTIDKLNERNINVFRTDLQGTIIATSDGNAISFNVKPVDKAADIPGTPK